MQPTAELGDLVRGHKMCAVDRNRQFNPAANSGGDVMPGKADNFRKTKIIYGLVTVIRLQ